MSRSPGHSAAWGGSRTHLSPQGFLGASLFRSICSVYFFLCPFKKMYLLVSFQWKIYRVFLLLIYLFLEGGAGRENERKTNIDVREKHLSVASCTHPQPRYAPWPEIKLVAFPFTGQCPANGTTLVRTVLCVSSTRSLHLPKGREDPGCYTPASDDRTCGMFRSDHLLCPAVQGVNSSDGTSAGIPRRPAQFQDK